MCILKHIVGAFIYKLLRFTRHLFGKLIVNKHSAALWHLTNVECILWITISVVSVTILNKTENNTEIRYKNEISSYILYLFQKAVIFAV